ncbi:unnamed protein product [Arctogadus glacialis]
MHGRQARHLRASMSRVRAECTSATSHLQLSDETSLGKQSGTGSAHAARVICRVSVHNHSCCTNPLSQRLRLPSLILSPSSAISSLSLFFSFCLLHLSIIASSSLWLVHGSLSYVLLSPPQRIRYT